MMAEFQTIETQEEFDAAIRSRLERERNKYAEQLADYDATKKHVDEMNKQIADLNDALTLANEKIATFDSQMADKDTTIKNYELRSVKTQIAHEYGLSYEAIEFLKGDDEDAIRKSADSLKTLVGATHSAPIATSEPTITANADEVERSQELRSLLSKLRKEE